MNSKIEACQLTDKIRAVLDSRSLNTSAIYAGAPYKISGFMHGYRIRNQNALHFLTLTVVDWVDVFSRRLYKDMLIESLQFCQNKKGLIIYAYVIMSNHLFFIVKAKNGFRLSNILRDFKKFTAVRLSEDQLKNGTQKSNNFSNQI